MRGKRKIPCVLRLRKNELYIDFNLKKCNDILSLIKSYISYFNRKRPMYCLKYKTPHQYKTEMGY